MHHQRFAAYLEGQSEPFAIRRHHMHGLSDGSGIEHPYIAVLIYHHAVDTGVVDRRGCRVGRTERAVPCVGRHLISVTLVRRVVAELIHTCAVGGYEKTPRVLRVHCDTHGVPKGITQRIIDIVRVNGLPLHAVVDVYLRQPPVLHGPAATDGRIEPSVRRGHGITEIAVWSFGVIDIIALLAQVYQSPVDFAHPAFSARIERIARQIFVGQQCQRTVICYLVQTEPGRSRHQMTLRGMHPAELGPVQRFPFLVVQTIDDTVHLHMQLVMLRKRTHQFSVRQRRLAPIRIVHKVILERSAIHVSVREGIERVVEFHHLANIHIRCILADIIGVRHFGFLGVDGYDAE